MKDRVLMIMGALILVGGGSYAAYDYLRGGTVAPGEPCQNSEHCASGACIHAGADITGVCADECGPGGGCEPGFVCQTVDYEAAGTTVENYGAYCLPAG
jgi:hypothetical protein